MQSSTFEEKFDTIPIRTLVFKLGIPAMFAQFFNILYSIVDRIFVGNIQNVGEVSLASIGICAPLLTLISAFAYLVGIGGSSVMSISLGRKDFKEAQKAINNAVVMLLAIGIIVTIIALFLKKDIIYMLGSSDRMYPYASKYFTIYVMGTCISLLGLGMNQFILAQGFAKEGMISVIIGALVNLVLDPLLIFYFNLGISGAAIATVASQFCTMIYVFYILFRESTPIKIEFGGYDFKIIKWIVSIGIMSFLITFLDNFIVILLNTSLRKYGGDAFGDTYISCVAILQSFLVIVFCQSQGITTGCATLFSYHYGAKNYDKFMEVFKYVFILCGIYIGMLMILSQTYPQIFVRLFSNNPEYIELTSVFIKKYTIGLVGVAAQYAFVDGLTAMGKIKYALPLSLFRKILYMLCVIILPLVTNVENIFYAGSISDVFGASFTIIVFYTIIRKKLKNYAESK